MKEIFLLLITLTAVAFNGYSQVDYQVSGGDFFPNVIPVGGTSNYQTFISINETSPGGELAPGCLDIIVSLPASGAYKPTGGAAGVSMTGIGSSFTWIYDPMDNALYGNNIVTLADGDGGLLTINITGFSIIGSGVTTCNASDALSCTNSNDPGNDFTNASLTITAPLPVKLSEFKSRSIDCKGVQLNWITESEINSKGFNVERSLDGKEFEKVAFISSNQNSSVVREYSYEDVNFKTNGTYYYRLVELDLDGTFKISETISHVYNCFDVTDFSIYPNPTSDKLNLNFNGIKGQVIVMDLLDVQGKLVRKVTVDTGNPQELSVKDIAPGFFILYNSTWGSGDQPQVH